MFNEFKQTDEWRNVFTGNVCLLCSLLTYNKGVSKNEKKGGVDTKYYASISRTNVN